MSTGWKKWECPPDMFSVEQKLGTLQLTDDQTDRMALAYFEVEMKRAKDNDVRQKWAAQYVKTQAKIIKKDLKEAFVEDFQLWLQGRSKYCQPTIKVPIKERDGETKIVTRTATPWGNKGLLHLPEVCEWLKKPILNRDKVIKKVAELQLGPLKTIDECWLYYKYITRAVAVDGDIIKEQRNYNVFDYLEQRPLKLNEYTGKMEEDNKYTPMQIKNPSMPKFDSETYNMVAAACSGMAAAGNSAVLRTPEYNDLMPGDKIMVLSLLSEKIGGIVDPGPAKTALEAYFTDLVERAGVVADAPTPPIGSTYSSSISSDESESFLFVDASESESEEPLVKKIKKTAIKKFPDLSSTVKKTKEVLDYITIPDTASDITDKALESKKKETIAKVKETKKKIAYSFEEWKADPKAKKNKDAIFGLFGELKSHISSYTDTTSHLQRIPIAESYSPGEGFHDRTFFTVDDVDYASNLLWDEIIKLNKGESEMNDNVLSRTVAEIYIGDFMLNYGTMASDGKYANSTAIIDKLMNVMPGPTEYENRIVKQMQVLKENSVLFNGIAKSTNINSERDKSAAISMLALLSQATLDARWGRQAFQRLEENGFLMESSTEFMGGVHLEAEWILGVDEALSIYFERRKDEGNALPEFLQLEGPLRKRMFLNSIFRGREDHIDKYYPSLAPKELKEMIETIAGPSPPPPKTDDLAFRSRKPVDSVMLESMTGASRVFTHEEDEEFINKTLPERMEHLKSIMASPSSHVIKRIEQHLQGLTEHLVRGDFTFKDLLDNIIEIPSDKAAEIAEKKEEDTETARLREEIKALEAKRGEELKKLTAIEGDSEEIKKLKALYAYVSAKEKETPDIASEEIKILEEKLKEIQNITEEEDDEGPHSVEKARKELADISRKAEEEERESVEHLYLKKAYLEKRALEQELEKKENEIATVKKKTAAELEEIEKQKNEARKAELEWKFTYMKEKKEKEGKISELEKALAGETSKREERNAELRLAQENAYRLHHELENARSYINKIVEESYPKEEVEKQMEQLKNTEKIAKDAQEKVTQLTETLTVGEQQFKAAVDEIKKGREQLLKAEKKHKQKEFEHNKKYKEQVETTLLSAMKPMEEFINIPPDQPLSIAEQYRFGKARKNLLNLFDTHKKITGEGIMEHLNRSKELGIGGVEGLLGELRLVDALMTREKGNEKRNFVKEYLQKEAVESANMGRQMNMDPLSGIMGEDDVQKLVSSAIVDREKEIKRINKMERDAQINQFVLGLANTANEIDKQEAITKLDIILSDPSNQSFLEKEDLTRHLAEIAKSISGLHRNRRENELEKKIMLEQYKKMEQYSEALTKQLIINREQALKEGIDLETQHHETEYSTYMADYSSGRMTYENARITAQQRATTLNDYLATLQEQGDILTRERTITEENMKHESETAINLAQGIESYRKAIESGMILTDEQKKQGEDMVVRHAKAVENLFTYNKEVTDIKSKWLKTNLKYETINNIRLAYQYTFVQRSVSPGLDSVPARQAIGYVEGEARRKMFEDSFNVYQKFQDILTNKKNIYRFSTTHLKGAAASLRSIEKSIGKYSDSYSQLEATFANNISNTAATLENLANMPIEDRHRLYPRNTPEEISKEMTKKERERMVKEGKTTGDFAKRPYFQRAEDLRAESLIRLIRTNTEKQQETQLSEREGQLVKKYQSIYGKAAKEKLPREPLIKMTQNDQKRRLSAKESIVQDKLQLAIYKYSKEVESGGFNPQANPLLGIMGGNLVQGPQMSIDSQTTAKTVTAITAVSGGVDKLVRNLSNMLGDEAERDPQTARLVELAEKFPDLTREVLEQGYVLKDKELPPLLESGYQEVAERAQDVISTANTTDPETMSRRKETIEEMYGNGFKDTEKYMDTLKEFGKNTLNDPKREDYAAFMDGYAYDLYHGFMEEPKYFTSEAFYDKFISGYDGSKKMRADNILKNVHSSMEELGESYDPSLVREAALRVNELISFVGNETNLLKDRGTSEKDIEFKKMADATTTDLELMDVHRSVMVSQGTRLYPGSNTKTINQEFELNPKEILRRMSLSAMYKGYRVNRANKLLSKRPAVPVSVASVRKPVKKTGRVVPYNLRSLNNKSKR